MEVDLRILLGLCFIIFFNINNSIADELVISNKLSLHYSEPKLIAHSSGVLIAKYDNWYFSHELVNPKSFYGIVDLTGIEHDFLRHVFFVKTKHELPKWIIELAREQTQSFGIKKSNIFKASFDSYDILSNYVSEAKEGNIFILEEHQIHKVNVFGEKDKFEVILKAIQERKHEY